VVISPIEGAISERGREKPGSRITIEREQEHAMDSLTGALTDNGPLALTERKLVEDAAEYVGEQPVRVVFRGQTILSPALLPIIGPLFMARPRSVIVTDRSVITVQESIWFQSRVLRVISSYRRGSVSLGVTRFALKVGDDPKIFAMLGGFPAMRRVAVIGSQAAA
jgi:hypothetical protein